MKKNGIIHPLLAAGLSAALLGACAPAHSDAPAPLNTPADMWAEIENSKSEVRRLNAKVEELSQQVQANKNDPALANRVNRLDGQVHRMASQLSIDLGDGAPAQPAAQPGYAQPQAGYAAPAQPGYQPPQAAYPTAPNPDEDDSGAAAPPVQQPAYQQPAYQQPAAPAPAPAAANQNPADALYAKGLASFNARQYQQALGIFQEFTKGYKTSPMMPNALFWTGECYFQLGDFANAALSYQEIIEKYPKSAKHPDALFKRGAAFLKLGNSGAAKLSFKEVIDKYPDSAFAARAKSMMPK